MTDPYGTPPAVATDTPADLPLGAPLAMLPPEGPARISQACFVTWSRFDPAGLAAHKEARGGLIVRVPVPRQRWPNRTMTD